MDDEKLRKLISIMYLDVLTGDVHTRNQYINVLLTHVAMMVRNKVEKQQVPIQRFRTLLHNTISMILHNNHPLPIYSSLRENEIANLEKYFDRFVIRVTPEIVDTTSIEQLNLLADIETLEYCRNVCYTASGDYSESLSGRIEGLTNANNKFSYVIDLITPVIYRHNLADISDSAFANASKVAASRAKEG